jgi:cell division septal protein FtsQ
MKAKLKILEDKKYVTLIFVGIFIIFVTFYGKKTLSYLPYFKIKRIVINGNRALSKGDVLNLLMVGRDESILTYNKDAALKRFNKTGIIKEIKIATVYPDTVKVYLREKYPIACIKSKKRGKVFYYLTDGDANIIAERSSMDGVNLPLIVLTRGSTDNISELKENLKKTLYSLSVVGFNDKSDLERIKQLEIIAGSGKVIVWVDGFDKKFIVRDFLRVKDFLEIKSLLQRNEINNRRISTIDLRFNDIIAR